MKIAIILDVDHKTGGAIAANRLVAGLLRQGHTVRRFVKFDGGAEFGENTVYPSRSKLVKIAANLAPALARDQVESGASVRWLKESLEQFGPDVIHIHSFVMANRSLPFSATETCNRIAPTVWTLHDMWTFTGRCIYSFDCRKFVTGCDASCETSHEFPVLPARRIEGEWSGRRAVLNRCPEVAAVSPSSWLAKEAQSGLWAEHRVEVIQYGVPLDVFRPHPRGIARQMLGIEANGPVVLMGALNLSDKRKGLAEALAAFKKLSAGSITLITMGRGNVTWNLGPNVQLGEVDDNRLKALAYSAADVYVHSALADNLPNMVLESIACGTPAVAFRVGGLPDMVRPGVSGWLAAEVTVDALTEALGHALDEVQRGRDLRQSCRKLAEAEYSEDLQAARYLQLYESLRESVIAAAVQ